MTQIPTFQLGRNWASCTITPQTVASDGTLTDATPPNSLPVSIIGVVKTCKRTQTNETENVSATPRRAKNFMITETECVYELTGLMLANDSVTGGAVTKNLVDYLAQSVDYVKLAVNMTGKTETYFGVLNSFETGIETKGSVPWTLRLQQCDIGTANPVFT